MRDEDIPFGDPSVKLPPPLHVVGGYEAEASGPAPPPHWLVDAGDLLDRGDPGPTLWLVEQLIVESALVAVVGKWKTTKSYGMLDLCIAVATGRPVFGRYAIPTPGRVFFVNEESGEHALWRRLDALCRGRAIVADELRGRWLLSANHGVKLDDPAWQDRILTDGLRYKPRLVVFDPLARMKAPGRNESAQNEIAYAIEFMRRLRNETGAAVAFVHHLGHQGEYMRGSSDLETAWESRLAWKREDGSSEVTVTAEHREAEPPSPFKYRIAWDSVTRSMRFKLVADPFTEFAFNYRAEHPESSANAIYNAAEGLPGRPTKGTALRIIKDLPDPGFAHGNRPETGEPDHPGGAVSPSPLSLLRREGVGNHPADHPLEPVSDDGTVTCPRGHTTTLDRVTAGVTYYACGCHEVINEDEEEV
jgi:AAA domain